MGAFVKLPSFFGEDLVDVAESYSYSEANLLILKGDIDALKLKYPAEYAALMSCVHNRDMRTPLQYAQDLVASWLFEDYIMGGISDGGMKIVGAGADKQREILHSRSVSAHSDTRISFNGNSRLLEIMTDYGGYWSRNGVLDLRDSKYSELRRTNSLFVGFSVEDSKFLLLDFSKDINATFISCHHPYGGKPAYRIHCRAYLKDYSTQCLIEDLKRLI